MSSRRSAPLAAAAEEVGRVVESLRGLGEAAWTRGGLAASEQFFSEALAVDEGLLRGEHLSYAETLLGLARVQLDRGDFDAAQGCIEQALVIEQKVLDPNHPRVAISLQRLLQILLHQDDLDRDTGQCPVSTARDALGRLNTMTKGSLMPWRSVDAL